MLLNKPAQFKRGEDMIEQIKKRAHFLENELKNCGILRMPDFDSNYSCGDIDINLAVNAIDHTVLSFNATEKDIDKACADAGKFKFKAICINPVWVKRAFDRRKKEGHEFLIATVIDFPLGASSLNARIAETKQAVADGADENRFRHKHRAFKKRNIERDIYKSQRGHRICKKLLQSYS
jgi:hypothetical protein